MAIVIVMALKVAKVATLTESLVTHHEVDALIRRGRFLQEPKCKWNAFFEPRARHNMNEKDEVSLRHIKKERQQIVFFSPSDSLSSPFIVQCRSLLNVRDLWWQLLSLNAVEWKGRKQGTI